jgi:uncharacterized protein (DUF58 family)
MVHAPPRPDRRPLLDPALLTALGDLEFVARVTVEGSVAGLHRSPFHGYSAEFSQYRHYRPGDDLKYVDWKLLARTDRIYTRQYRETTNVAAQIALDTSGSMAFRGRSGVTKLEYARLLAAALAHLVSRQGDAVGLVAFSDRVEQYLPSRSGPSHLRSLLLGLSRVEAGGGTAAGVALRRGIDLLRRRGLLLVISDLYDEADEVERELRRAARIGHEIAIFHVLTRDELEFPYAGDVELEDLETGARLRAGAGEAGDRYRAAFAAFLERWRTRCLASGIGYTRVLTDQPLDTAVRAYLVARGGGRTS